MNETIEDQVGRVELMASGDPQWDLSDNDRAALRTVLDLAQGATKVAGFFAELARGAITDADKEWAVEQIKNLPVADAPAPEELAP